MKSRHPPLWKVGLNSTKVTAIGRQPQVVCLVAGVNRGRRSKLEQHLQFPNEVKHCVLMVIAGNAAIKEMHHFSTEVMKAAEILFF